MMQALEVCPLEDFIRELECLRKAIDEAMEGALLGYPCDVPLIREAMVYSAEGGKRLRGAIVLSTYKDLGGDGDAMHFALAIEMIQAYSLVHDDLPCMDDAEMRRGRPACHKKFGEAMGVLAGDALLTLAFETAASSDLPPYRVVEGIKALAYGAGAAGMVGGQVLDLQPEAIRCGACPGGPSANGRAGAAGPSDSDSPGDLADPENLADRVRLMYRLKTGRLFETAAKLGAILAGAPAATVERAAEAGMHFGFAFQILDDIEDAAQGGVEEDKDTLLKRISLEKAREEAIMGFQRCKQLAGSGRLLARLADHYLVTRLGV
jgi:geranylgeranyl diphosphate synthase type II